MEIAASLAILKNPMPSFIQDVTSRQFALEAGLGFTPVGLYLGKGSMALEVCVLEKSGPEPTAVQLRSAWKERNAWRAAPVRRIGT
jgi:hypothetical protein